MDVVRSVNLLKIAAEAELVRYHMAARQGRCAALGAIALVFVLAVLVLGEVAAWLALYLRFEATATTLIRLGINLVIAIVFGLLAAKSSPSRAGGLTGSAAVARCRAWGTVACCPCPGWEHPSATLAQ